MDYDRLDQALQSIATGLASMQNDLGLAMIQANKGRAEGGEPAGGCVNLNLNSKVYFGLTDDGEKILAQHDLIARKEMERYGIKNYHSEVSYTPETNTYSCSLWECMAIFGYHLYNGGPVLFKDNAILSGVGTRQAPVPEVSSETRPKDLAAVARIKQVLRDHLMGNGWKLINGDATAILDEIQKIEREALGPKA